MKKLALILSSLVVCSSIVAQTLLTINDREISKQEFEYYYKKNNHIESDTLSAEAYMEMFINFKLKVEEAYSLKYDTANSFSEEFNAYRAPLAAAYLTDSVKIKEFEKEAYNNLLKDIYVSHILFRTDFPEDSVALEKALAAKKRSKKMDFNKLAVEVSEDPSVRYNEGNLGWVTGMTMVYPFENAAFSLKKGKISDPIKTNFGYHLIKVHKTRPTRGEVQVAHIFKRKPEDADSAQIDAIRQEMHRIHSVLENGGLFEDLVKAHSEDKNTKPGGILPYWVSTGQTNELFEDAAFALKYPGDFSQVVEAPYGFHIIQLIEKHDKPDYNRWMPQIQTRIRMDERAALVRESFINKTRKEYKLADTLTDIEVLRFADANLEKKYPEFGYLMQEYRDGILLFNISKDVVWDKASKDEEALKAIYEKGNFDKPYNKVRGIVISQYQDELEKNWIKQLREKYTIKVNQNILKTIK